QCRQERLEDESRAAGRADVEVMVAAFDAAWPEGEGTRVELRALDRGAADACGGSDGGQVLVQQPGALAPGAHAVDPERPPGDQAQAERRAHDLPTALALRAVDDERLPVGRPAHPLTQTTWRSVCTISTRSFCASITASMSL